MARKSMLLFVAVLFSQTVWAKDKLSDQLECLKKIYRFTGVANVNSNLMGYLQQVPNPLLVTAAERNKQNGIYVYTPNVIEFCPYPPNPFDFDKKNLHNIEFKTDPELQGLPPTSYKWTIDTKPPNRMIGNNMMQWSPGQMNMPTRFKTLKCKTVLGGTPATSSDGDPQKMLADEIKADTEAAPTKVMTSIKYIDPDKRKAYFKDATDAMNSCQNLVTLSDLAVTGLVGMGQIKIEDFQFSTDDSAR